MVELNLGRFLAYVAFGALFGLLGGALPAAVRGPLAAAGYILFAVFLLLSVARIRKSCGGGCATPRLLSLTRSPLLLGILTGFSVCPSFLIAVTGAFESSGPVSGMLLFTGFFAGTTAWMLPFSLLGLFTRRSLVTAAARVAAVIVGVYFLAVGIRFAAALPGGGGATVDAGGDREGAAVYSVMEEDTVWVVGFPSDSTDHAADLAAGLSGGPAFVFVAADSSDPHAALEGVPDLATVMVPAWADPRSGIEPAPWQAAFSQALALRRARVFAVEYEPWCEDRAVAIRDFLDRYSFRVDPDSGFTFLMQNSLDCLPEDCSTCPAAP